MGEFGERQNAIYLRGFEGETPSVPFTPEGLESGAREVLSPEVFGYVAGSAGRETTAAANLGAFTRWRIVPRMLREILERDLTTEVLGTRLSAPVLTAPVGALSAVRPDAECAVARGAAAVGIGCVVSTLTSVPMETIAAQSDQSPHWFQLYWPKSRDLALSFVRRAEASGYSAIVVTVDTWTLAWRPRDLAAGYLPFLHGHGLANYFSDPVFRDTLGEPPEAGPEAARAAVLAWLGVFSNPALGWSDLAWLTEQTDLPVLVKGINHPDDARAAVETGVAGIVVSNHGGRQMDGGRASLDCLVDVAAAVGRDVPLLFDSGIRGGSDILIALALGARAVLVGRPWVYGLAIAGEEGVATVLRNLLGELDITLGLAGYSTAAELRPEALVRA